jgi:hypothetical protein
MWKTGMATKWRDPLMIKTMRQRAIRLTQLKKGPVRHPVLPEDLFLRVKAFKEILAEVDNMTLDEVIEVFSCTIRLTTWRSSTTYFRFS